MDFLSQTGFEIEIGANFYKLRNKKERPNVVASFQGSRSNDEDNSDEDDNDVNNDGNGCFFSSLSAVPPTLSHFLSVVRVSICFLLSAGSTNTVPVIQNIFLPIFLRLFLSFSFNLSQYLDAFSVIATYYFESFSTFLSPSQIYFLPFLRYTFSLSLILSLQPCCPINCPSFFLLSPRVSLLFERQFIKDRRFSFFIITQHFLKVDTLTGY